MDLEGSGRLRCEWVCRHLHSLKPSLNFNYVVEEPDIRCFQKFTQECLTGLKAFRKKIMTYFCYCAESGTATQSSSEGWQTQLDPQNHV